jgi:hypothetical protein
MVQGRLNGKIQRLVKGVLSLPRIVRQKGWISWMSSMLKGGWEEVAGRRALGRGVGARICEKV